MIVIADFFQTQAVFGPILAVKATSKVVTTPNFEIFLRSLKYEYGLSLKKIRDAKHGVGFTL